MTCLLPTLSRLAALKWNRPILSFKYALRALLSYPHFCLFFLGLGVRGRMHDPLVEIRMPGWYLFFVNCPRYFCKLDRYFLLVLFRSSQGIHIICLGYYLG